MCVLLSGCVKLSTEERPPVHEGQSNVSPLVDGQQTVWFDVSKLGRRSSARTKCLQSNGSDP